jgi:hypothetical protein
MFDYEEALSLMVYLSKMRSVNRTIFKVPPRYQHEYNEPIGDGTRPYYETDAEHTALMIMFMVALDEFIPHTVDRTRLYQLAAFHDVSEIEVGDTHYRSADREEKKQLEREAVLVKFSQEPRLRELWFEADEKATEEAICCKHFDILQAVVSLYISKGYSWKTNEVTYRMEKDLCNSIFNDGDMIGNIVHYIIDLSNAKGYFYEE